MVVLNIFVFPVTRKKRKFVPGSDAEEPEPESSPENDANSTCQCLLTVHAVAAQYS
jgi:hypothetical protein